MPNLITIHDETAFGDWLGTVTLDFFSARISARDLIRTRVCEQIRDFSLSEIDGSHGFIEPVAAEFTFNGDGASKRPPIDVEEQVARALEAFISNGFFILVDDRQVETLDDAIELRAGTEITFIKLTPLVGG